MSVTLAPMTVRVNRNFNAGMVQLLRNLLNRRIVFAELNGCIAVAHVMNACSFFNTSVNPASPSDPARPSAATVPAKKFAYRSVFCLPYAHF